MALHLGLGQYLEIATYITFIVGCLASLLWRPTAGLYFLILALPQERLRSRLSDLPLGGHMLVLLLLCILLGAILRGQFPRRSTLNKVILIFCVFTFFSLILGTANTGLDLFLERTRHWKDYMILPLLFLASSTAIRTRQQFRMALVFVCLSVLIVNRSVALDAREHNDTHYDDSKRESGPLGNAGSNGVAAFESEMAILFMVLAGFQKKWTRKLVLYALFSLTVFCLLYAFSRGGYLAFLTACLVYAFVHHRKLIPALLILVLAWQVFLPNAVIERITMTQNESGKLDNSAAERVQLWDDALDLIVASPILGHGYDTYQYMGRVGFFRDTHNFYVKTLVETGVVGLGVFISILAGFWRQGWSLFRRAKHDPLFSGLGLGMATCTVSIAVANLFGDRWTYVGVTGLVWILFGLVVFAQSEMDRLEHPKASDSAISEPGSFAVPAGRGYSSVL